jgi:DNA processing protein
MLMRADARAYSHRGKRSSYTPPDSFKYVPIPDLLQGSPREKIEREQLALFRSVAAKSSDHQARLYVSGDTSLLKRRCIAIIGTRQVSAEGASRARRLARELVARDVVVVSGLADGVDTEALSAAIEDGGSTIAVIGTPLAQAYPAKNAKLQEAIYRDHLLVSQFPEHSRVFPSNFPERNRTMALLSDASVVIEASDSSGTLHQAKECERIGRWLAIAKSVVDNPSLTWPKQFLGKYKKCIVLSSTDELLETVYGEQ